tara:strand:- start:2495 stop:2992 length:498 start_codon:yes stop_codon:yes gene_type:complete
MWVVLKFDKNNLELLKGELKKKLGNDFSFYNPKFFFQTYSNNSKRINKEVNLLGDYLFCFHKNFNNPNTLNNLKFTKGLKYFLTGFKQSQKEIKEFIKRCKESEQDGYLTKNFFELYINSKYKFTSGPFTQTIFKIINLQKNKINILLGDIKTTIRKNDFSFSPI